jgi:hypothetical protein
MTSPLIFAGAPDRAIPLAALQVAREAVSGLAERIAGAPAEDIIRAQNSIFDGHNPLRVQSAMGNIETIPGLTVADVSSIAACVLANCMAIVLPSQRRATLAAILAMSEVMLKEALDASDAASG